MDKESHQSVLEAEQSMKKFYNELQEFTQKRLITSGICYNLHLIFKCIEEFMADPNLKYVDVKSSQIPSTPIASTSQASSKSINYELKTNTVKTEQQTFEELLKKHSICLKNCLKSMCELCGVNIAVSPVEYQKHLRKRHALEGCETEIKLYIEEFYEQKYFCNLCKRDIGHKANVQNHIENNCIGQKQNNLNSDKQLTFFRTFQSGYVANPHDTPSTSSGSVQSNSVKMSQSSVIVKKAVKSSVCKTCGRQVTNSEEFLLEHLRRSHQIFCTKDSNFRNLHYYISTQYICYCNLCHLDVGNECNVERHVATIKHKNALKRSDIDIENVTEITVDSEKSIKLENQIKFEPIDQFQDADDNSEDDNKNNVENSSDDNDESEEEEHEDYACKIFKNKYTFNKFLNKSITKSNKLQNYKPYKKIINDLKKIIRKIYSNAKLYMQGPHVFGLGYFEKTVEIFVDTDSSFSSWPIDSNEIINQKIHKIILHLKNNYDSTKVKFETTTFGYDEHPVIKANFIENSYNFRLTFTNGIEHSKVMLLKHIFEKQPLCQKLSTVLMKIVKDNELDGFLDPYDIAWMVVYFLQRNDYLPSIKSMQEKCTTKTKIGPYQISYKDLTNDDVKLVNSDDQFYRVTKALLQFYASKVNYYSEVICPYYGRQINKNYLDNELMAAYNKIPGLYEHDPLVPKYMMDASFPLYVQDPIELCRNLSEFMMEDYVEHFTEALEEAIDSYTW